VRQFACTRPLAPPTSCIARRHESAHVVQLRAQEKQRSMHAASELLMLRPARG